jgi:ribonuclease HII
LRCTNSFENEARKLGYLAVAGVDEVGRGALFGCVVAAAVILNPERPVRGLNDSKLLSPEVREELAAAIKERAVAWSTGAADAAEIDRVNIYQASRLAMRRAVEALPVKPDYLLVDAMRIELNLPQESLIKGDARSRAIAAASIIAKVHRDECMRVWDAVYPEYGLSRHKGYGAPEHLRALESRGPTPLHRFSYAPVGRLSAAPAPQQSLRFEELEAIA